MKTVLYFQSGLNEDSLAKLEGVCRYAKAARWRVQTVLYADASFGRISCGGDCSDVARLIDLWKPAGAIVESGSLRTRLTAQAFGGLPLVFLDRDAEPGAVCVTSDARAVAEAAAHGFCRWGARPTATCRSRRTSTGAAIAASDSPSWSGSTDGTAGSSVRRPCARTRGCSADG